MKRRLLIILFLILIWGLHASWAQQGKSVIPYRIVGGKMIIEMFVNGKLQNFILTREDKLLCLLIYAKS